MTRGTMAKAVVVHDLGQAEAALAAAAALKQPIAIWSAPDAALRAGVGWFAALARQARATRTQGKGGLHPRLRRSRRSGAGRLPRRPGRCLLHRPAGGRGAPGRHRAQIQGAAASEAAPAPSTWPARGISPRRSRHFWAAIENGGRLGYSKRPIRAVATSSHIVHQGKQRHEDDPAGPQDPVLLRERQSGHQGQSRPHPDAGAPRRHRAAGDPAGRSGLRAWPGAQLRPQPRRL